MMARRDPMLLVSGLTWLAFLILWEVSATYRWINPAILPAPSSLFHTAADLFRNGYAGTSIWTHIAASLGRSLAGLFIGILIGTPVGLVVGLNRVVAAILSPLFSFLRPIPPIAFIPLFIMFFGIGETPKIALISMASFLYMVLNTVNGVRSVSLDLKRAGQVLGASQFQMLFRVVLPATLPFVMNGIKTSTALCWAIMVAAELVAAQSGLGYMIMDAANIFAIPVVYVGIALIGVIGLLFEVVTSRIERRVLHWQGK